MQQEIAARYFCLQCMDGLWVCADHPAVPWDEGQGCGCGAEGAKCPSCNPDARMPPGFTTIATTEPEQ